MPRPQQALQDVTNFEDEISNVGPAVDKLSTFRSTANAVATFFRRKRVPTQAEDDKSSSDYGEQRAAGMQSAPDPIPSKSINVSVEPDLDTCDTALKNAACVGDQRMVTTPSKATQSSRVTRTAKNQAYPRKVAPTISRQAADAAERYISSMKAHFDEIDAFELEVESDASPPRIAREPAESAYGTPASIREDDFASSSDLTPKSEEASEQEPEAAHSSQREGSASNHKDQSAAQDTINLGGLLAAAPLCELKTAASDWDPCTDSDAPARRQSHTRNGNMSMGMSKRRSSQYFLPSRQSADARPSTSFGEVSVPSPQAIQRRKASDRFSTGSAGLSLANLSLGSRFSVGSTSALGTAQHGETLPGGTMTVSPIQESPSSLIASPTPAKQYRPATPSARNTFPVAIEEYPDTEDHIGRPDLSEEIVSPTAAVMLEMHLDSESSLENQVDSLPAIECSSSRVLAAAKDSFSDEVARAAATGRAGADTAEAVPSDFEEPLVSDNTSVTADECLEPLASEETALERLLSLCGQKPEVKKLPSMTRLLSEHVNLKAVRKIGEGTYGEAFAGAGVVFKIIPMEGDTKVNGEPQKRASEILAEVEICWALSGLRGAESSTGVANETAGFVRMLAAGVCRGRYAHSLTKEWHAWDKIHGSENDEVDTFCAGQLYVVEVLEDGGTDLEHFAVRDAAEARSILFQVALTIAVAEEEVRFEHRDLHWGNLLIRRHPTDVPLSYRFRNVAMSAKGGGLQVTLIDFTLSRLTLPSGAIAFCDLSADPDLFEGPKNDYQAETYRRMKATSGNGWAGHFPQTNAMWMAYLTDAMLTLKAVSMSVANKRQFRSFRKRALSTASCGNLVFDDFFATCWTVQ